MQRTDDFEYAIRQAVSRLPTDVAVVSIFVNVDIVNESNRYL